MTDRTEGGAPDPARRGLVLGAAAIGAAGLVRTARAEGNAPTAGPIQPGRGSTLAGKVAVVTGAARGIGRAIAVGLAAHGAGILGVGVCRPVRPAAHAKAATPPQ